jgi:hypothetical protein
MRIPMSDHAGRNQFRWLFVLAVGMLTVHSGAVRSQPSPVDHEACGLAPILGPQDVPRARDEATRDALRRVVETVLGVEISAATETERFELVKDLILVQSRGYVESFEIVEENPQNDLFQVCIRARVGTGRYRGSCRDHGSRFIELMGNPTIVVVATEENPDFASAATPIQARATQWMRAAGYTLIDPESVAELNDRALIRSAIAHDYAPIATAGGTAGADYVLLIHSSSLVSGRTEGRWPIVTVRSLVSVSCIVNETAEQILSEDLGEFPGAKATADTAVREALEAAMEKLPPMLCLLPAAIGGPMTFTVSVTNSTMEDQERIRSSLARQRFVVRADRIGFKGDTGWFKVRAACKAADLCDALSRSGEPPMDVISHSLGTIELSLRR